MNSKSLRRLAADHASLQTAGLPPNYLFPPNNDFSDNLTTLDVLLAGPESTPYSCGVWKLTLSMPPTYPNAPPTAAFKTRIWHPNVEEATGAVCVDTLKRDWKKELTLRDVLVTISCLLVYPNPASALNAEAGALMQDDWGAFERRAKLMTGIHAPVPKSLKEAVHEARREGEEKESEGLEESQNGNVRSKGKEKAKERVGKVTEVVKEEAENVRDGANRMEADDDDQDWISAPDGFQHSSSNGLGIMTTSSGTTIEMDVDKLIVPAQRPMQLSTPARQLDTHNVPISSTSQQITVHTEVDIGKKQASLHVASTTTTSTTSLSSQELRALFSTSSQNVPWALPDDGLDNSPNSTRKRERPSEAARREKMEYRRFKAAGFSIKRYNRGTFGPRKGLRRL